MEAFRQLESWPAANVAAAVIRGGEPVATYGNSDREYRWASITKPVTALACLVAAEEGSLDLDEPAGPEGSTVRHLLAHASGLPFDQGAPIARPGDRRIYSEYAYKVLGDKLAARAEMPFFEYLTEAVLEPLGLGRRFDGAPGSGLHGSLEHLIALARELLAPTLVSPETFAEATSVQFPGLVGVLPGFGRQEPNDWGLGFELRDGKSPHWTGTLSSPSTFGHFGGSGTFLWVDPERQVALGCLTDKEFDEWAAKAWPPFSDAVLDEISR